MLEGTVHIALIYTSAFLSLIYLALSGKLKNVVQSKTKLVLSKKKSKILFYLIAFVGISTFILVIYVVLNFHKIITVSTFDFWTYAVSLFVILPISFSLLGAQHFLKEKNIQVKKMVIVLVAFSLIGLAANNLHDFIWCYDVTDGYTKEVNGGDELAPWTLLANTPDYNVFGKYMIVQAALLFSSGIALFYYQFNARDFKKIFLKAFLYLIVLGVLFYIVDMPVRFSGLPMNFALFVGLPVMAETLAIGRRFNPLFKNLMLCLVGG